MQMIMNELPLQPARRIRLVEAARGVCASYVVIAHVFQVLGYKYSIRADFPLMVDLLSGYPHQAVLFFFLLSGFSIHYSCIGSQLNTFFSVVHYVYLRLRRVYPIFLLAILGIFIFYFLGSMLGIGYYQDILAGLRFNDVALTSIFLADRSTACGRLATVLPTNPPFWSLSYEILYYFLYPIFWNVSRRSSIFVAVGIGCLISIGAYFLGRLECGHFSNVLSLYFVWCLGALLAEYKRRGMVFFMPRSVFYLAPYFSVLLVWVIAQSRYSSFDTLLWVVVFFVFMAFPISSGFAARLSKKESIACFLFFLISLLCVFLLSMEKALSDDMDLFYRRCLVFFGLWVGLTWSDGQEWRSSFLLNIVSKFYWLGGISYGLYLIHYYWLIFGRELSHFWSLPVHYALLVLPVVFYLAWFLEIRCQPWIATRLDRMWLYHSGVKAFSK